MPYTSTDAIYTSSNIKIILNILVTILQDNSISFKGEANNMAVINNIAVISNNVWIGILFKEFQDLGFFKKYPQHKLNLIFVISV